MKLNLLPLIVMPLVGCAQIKGNANTGEYSANFFVTDFKGYAQTANRAVIIDQNQSKVPLSAVRTIGTIAASQITANLSEIVSNNSTAEVLGAQGVTSANNAGKHATDQLRIVTDGKVKLIEAVPGVPKP